MDYLLGKIAEFVFIRTARVVLGVFDIEAPDLAELMLGLALWALGGAIVYALLR